MVFYERISELAKERKTSISAVAAALGFSNSTPTSWKKGTIPSADALSKLADYFEVSTDYLLGRTDDPDPDARTLEHLAASSDIPINEWPDEKKEQLMQFIRFLDGQE